MDFQNSFDGLFSSSQFSKSSKKKERSKQKLALHLYEIFSKFNKQVDIILYITNLT